MYLCARAIQSGIEVQAEKKTVREERKGDRQEVEETERKERSIGKAPGPLRTALQHPE